MPRITYANVVSTLCLFLILGGGSAVALKGRNTVLSDDIRNGAVRSADVRDGDLTAADVQDSSLGAADVRDSSLGTADVQDSSLGGADVTDSSLGGSEIADSSLTGADVDESTLQLFAGNLPSGQTIRGFYEARSTKQAASSPAAGGAASFGHALASAPTDHMIEQGDAAPAQCPGSASSPQALPGHLCVYEFEALNAAGHTVNQGIGSNPATGRFGFSVRVIAEAGLGVGGTFGSTGTWAVTAP